MLLFAAFVLQAHTAIVVVVFVALYCFPVVVTVACCFMLDEVFIVRSLMFVCLCITLRTVVVLLCRSSLDSGYYDFCRERCRYGCSSKLCPIPTA